MKRLRHINFFLVVIALLLVNCTRSKIVHETDYDQLYAVWHDNDYKDSLALALKPAVEKALTLKNTVDNRFYIDSVLSQLRWTRDSVSFFKLSDKAVEYAKNKSDEYMLANIYNDIGMYYHDSNVLDSTYYYYIKAENVYKTIGDSMKIGEMEFYQARLLFEKGLTMESEVKVSNALHLLQKYPLNPVPFEANQLMALCLLERNDYVNAKSYLLTALTLMQKDLNKNKILGKKELSTALMMLYYNLSEVSYYLGDYMKASEYAALGLTHRTPNSLSIIVSFLESNIAKADLMLAVKDNKEIGAKEKSYITKLEKTYEHSLDINNYFSANEMAISTAELYFAIHDNVKAFEWAEKSYQLSKDRDIKVAQRKALEFIVTHKDYENNEQVKEIIKLTHDLDEIDYATRNKFARIAYETEKIETENVELKEVIMMLFITSLSIILALLLGVYVYRLKNKNREIRLIKGQQEANESIYQLILERGMIATEVKTAVRNKIARDIHDGVVNGIFTIRFNLQQLQTENESLKSILITELLQLEKSTRDISHSLIDNELFKDTKFLSLVEELVMLQKNQWNTNFTLEYEEDLALDNLTAIEKVNTYFIIREAIHNVNKYSEASQCTISFVKDVDSVEIKIKDNGVGFELHSKADGIGLANMSERALSLHSKLVMYSEKGCGVEVLFKISV
ncbi:sensor histidine kinase [Myroides sp. N17-2]|uniref:sensor histidine kinase n=1 Tax=Myroides sp. N17-2 TaxID=2030799 RepID=UPI000EFC374B|nr:ATP-binding protein [Myroides sp. N17-2]